MDDIVKNINSITIDEIKQIALDKITNTLLPKIEKQTIGFKINNDNNADDEDYSDGEFEIPVGLSIKRDRIFGNPSSIKKKSGSNI